MSASDEIKAALVEHFALQGVATTAEQWKRRGKKAEGDYVVRAFDNADAGLAVQAVTVDEEDGVDPDAVCVWEDGPIGFGIGRDGDTAYLSFTPMVRWERNATLPSLDDYGHYERGIAALPLDHCGDDRGDNRFAIRTDDVEAIRADLLMRGYTEIDLSTARDA